MDMAKPHSVDRSDLPGPDLVGLSLTGVPRGRRTTVLVDQLRRALAAIAAGGGSIGCLQAQLNIYNSDATWFTRQFPIEYTVLFDCILPALEPSHALAATARLLSSLPVGSIVVVNLSGRGDKDLDIVDRFEAGS